MECAQEQICINTPIMIRSDGRRGEVVEEEVKIVVVGKRHTGKRLYALRVSGNRIAERTGAKAEPIRVSALLNERHLRDMRDFIDRELTTIEAE